MRARQLSFLPKPALHHGGDTRKGKRKTARPIDPKRPIHLTLRSSRARGQHSMLHPRHASRVDAFVRRTAERHGIRLYQLVNVGNHLHLSLKTPSRRAFQAFLRHLAGHLAQLITGAIKGNAQGKFWDELAWTRIVSWGRDFDQVRRYLIKNAFEGAGLWNRRREPYRRLIALPRGEGPPPLDLGTYVTTT